MVLSNCTICDCKKSKFIKEQEARRMLSNLGIRTSLSQIPLVGSLLKLVFDMTLLMEILKIYLEEQL